MKKKKVENILFPDPPDDIVVGRDGAWYCKETGRLSIHTPVVPVTPRVPYMRCSPPPKPVLIKSIIQPPKKTR
jgi:hypothetical protein